MTMKPIETIYAGHRFRSRLEARWAVFFDALGVEWQYEPQGYKVDGKPYLPDFLLPSIRTFVEVKGDPGQLDTTTLINFAAETGHFVLILGQIPKTTPGCMPTHSLLSPIWGLIDQRDHEVWREGSLAIERLEDPEDRKKVWAFIRGESRRAANAVMGQECFFVPLTKGGVWTMALGPANLPKTNAELLSPPGYSVVMLLDKKVEAAYAAARQARFEHGETPKLAEAPAS